MVSPEGIILLGSIVISFSERSFKFCSFKSEFKLLYSILLDESFCGFLSVFPQENKTIEKEQLKRQQEDIERLKNEKERELRNNELNEQEQQMLSSSKEFNGMNDDDNSQENISISDASSVLSDLSYDYIDNSEINEEDNTDDDSIPKLKIFDNDVNNNIELEIEEL